MVGCCFIFFFRLLVAAVALSNGKLFCGQLGHGTVIQVIPLALSTATTVLLLLFGPAFGPVIVLSLNVTLGASLFTNLGFRYVGLAFVVFFAVVV